MVLGIYGTRGHLYRVEYTRIPLRIPVYTVLFKGTGRGRTRSNGATHTERGPGPSKTAPRHRPPHRPERRPEPSNPPGSEQKQPAGITLRPRTNPGTRQTAERATSNPHLDPPAPRSGQLSQKDLGPCRQRVPGILYLYILLFVGIAMILIAHAPAHRSCASASLMRCQRIAHAP